MAPGGAGEGPRLRGRGPAPSGTGDRLLLMPAIGLGEAALPSGEWIVGAGLYICQFQKFKSEVEGSEIIRDGPGLLLVGSQIVFGTL